MKYGILKSVKNNIISIVHNNIIVFDIQTSLINTNIENKKWKIMYKDINEEEFENYLLSTL